MSSPPVRLITPPPSTTTSVDTSSVGTICTTFATVCAAIQYATFQQLPVPPGWLQLRDQLYDALIVDAGLNLHPPPVVPWSALDDDEREFARGAYDDMQTRAEAAASQQPSSITPWWSAFFFSS